MSSNLISRSSGQQTRKGFVAIQKNSPFFLPRYLMVGYLGFYFTKALRTVLVPALRTVLTRVVVSTSTVGMSRIPTGTLRTSTSATTTLRIVWIRMVTSAAAAFGMSHLLPTGSPSTNAVSVVYGGIEFSVNITGDTYQDMYGIGNGSYGC